jgi:acetylornithine deacetylase/succinyl-diaminopimelate desuccinylase-like protein
MTLQSALAYAHKHQDRFLEELKALLRIPSISTLPDHADDIRRAAEWLADHMRAIGLEHVRVDPTAGHPVVVADWLHAPGRPTVLIYGHYDVQPVDPLDLWISDPFDPQVRDGNLYARGASDDKGPFFAHLKALEAYLRAAGTLPLNVKVLCEGEEEIGSAHLDAYVYAHAADLAADVVLISDTTILGPDQPSIVYGLRGLCYMEVEVTGPDHDLHSGQYGGAVHNPLQALCEMIAALHDAEGRVTLPGFYDKVRPLSNEERAEIARLPFDEERLKRETGVPAGWGEAGYTIAERIGARPTLEVNGVIGGWTGPGSKTVIPARALAKISMRLVADQDPDEIDRLFREHIQRIAPDTVRVAVRSLAHGAPALVDRHHPAMEAAARAYEAGFGARPVFTREGGSIPIVATFQKALGAPSVLMGLGLPDDRFHSPNEKFALANFYRGIATIIHFHSLLAEGG